jgi:hypothetical protein
MDVSSDKAKKGEAPAQETDKLLRAGNHAESVKKAEEALALLK